MIVFKVLFVLVVPCHSLDVGSYVIGYDCGTPSANYTTLDLTEIEDCVPAEKVHIGATQNVMVVQKQAIEERMVRTCLILITRHIYRCGMHSHISITPHGFSEDLVQILPSDCNRIHETKTFVYAHVTVVGLKVNSTISRPIVLAGGVYSGGVCKGGVYTDTHGTYSDVVVQATLKIGLYEQLGLIRVGDDTITIPITGLSCKYKTGSCMDDERGLATWSTANTEDHECGKYTIDILYQGEATVSTNTRDKRRLLIVERQAKTFAFTLGAKEYLCGREVTSTEHGRIFVAFISDRQTPWSNLPSITTRNIDLSAYIGSKFLYVTQSIEKNVEALAEEMFHRDCLTRRLTLENRLVLSRLAPDHVGQLVNGKGHFGRVLGEVLHIIQCVPVPVALRYTDKCYQEIPILHNNKSSFLTPVTHLLTRIGTVTPCKTLLSPQFKINGQWYSRTPELVKIAAPQKLTPNSHTEWTYTPLVHAGAGGLYSLEQIQNLQAEMLLPIVRDAVSTNLVRQSLSPSSHAFNPLSLWGQDDIDNLTDTISSKISFFFTVFGRYASIFVTCYIIWKITVYLISVILNCLVLSKKKKSKVWLCAGLADACTSAIVIHDEVLREILVRKKSKQNKAKVEDNCDDEDIELPTTITVVPSSPAPAYADALLEARKELISSGQIASHLPRGRIYPGTDSFL
nr:MAG: glycoprotein [Freshwater turtle neural virus 1]